MSRIADDTVVSDAREAKTHHTVPDFLTPWRLFPKYFKTQAPQTIREMRDGAGL
jgi:hypothetical protein